MYNVLLLLHLLVTHPAFADTTLPHTSDSTSFVIAKQPSYPGGLAAMNDFLSHNIHYPKDAQKKKISGTVLVQFTIEPDGSLDHLEVISEPLDYLDEEALRVIRSMPLWEPGAIKGPNGDEKVPVGFHLPIRFAL